MKRRMPAVLVGLRLVYALFWIAVAVSPLFGAPFPRQPTSEANAFWDALMATGFMVPLTGVTYLCGGVLCLLRRTMPLGLALLSAPLTVIVLFNALLVRQAGPWIVIALVQLVLMIDCRDAFAPLWSYGAHARNYTRRAEAALS